MLALHDRVAHVHDHGHRRHCDLHYYLRDW
jgi:hypothetical protein